MSGLKQTMPWSRAREWVHLIAVTGAAQVAVQAISFVSGILVIRLLPVHEYALYTLANTMLGTMTILADGGIAAGVMAEGGKVWEDKQKLGAVVATGMALRRKFAVFSLLVAVPILFYLLRKHDASWLMSTMIVLSLVPAFFSTLSGKLMEIPLKLHQEIKSMQQYQVEANAGRFALTALTLFVFPISAVALLAAGLGQAWNNFRLKQQISNFVDSQIDEDKNVKSNIIKIVRNQMPDAIFFCISGQLTIWSLSILGSTSAVANVGALGRLSATLSIIQVIIATLLIPRFSRLEGDIWSHRNSFFKIQFGLIALCLAIFSVCAIAPGPILSILGKSYASMRISFLLAIAGGCVNLVSAITHQLLASKGVILPAKWFVPLMAISQMALLFIIRPSETNSALIFSLMCSLSALLIRTAYIFVSAMRAPIAA